MINNKKSCQNRLKFIIKWYRLY